MLARKRRGVYKTGHLTLKAVKEKKDCIQGMTPLLLACLNGDLDSFLYLFYELGCLVSAQDKQGNTALHLAAQSDNKALIKELVHIDSDFRTMRSTKNCKGYIAE